MELKVGWEEENMSRIKIILMTDEDKDWQAWLKGDKEWQRQRMDFTLLPYILN
jgi:hypothetical protein